MTRPFRGLREAGPRAEYDAVIVGAGVGGLVCANLLAREGLRVLLVEQHYMVGGYCSTFRRKGYTFDAATHFYPLLGNPTSLTGRLLAELGAETRWIKMDPVDVFHLPDGSRFSVPADFETYRKKLLREFPDEAGALESFFAAARKAYLHGLLFHFRGRETEDFAALRELTLGDVLARTFSHPKLKLLLTADCAHWGSPPSRTSFVFDSMLRLAYFLGNYYPVGGSQAFADELARLFEQRGGHILMSTRAVRLQIADGQVEGVVLETMAGRLRGRHVVRAGAVVSNADLLQTLEALVEPENLPSSYLGAARRLRPSYPCFLVHIGLRGVSTADLEQAGGYYWDDWDPDAVGRDAFRFKLFAPTLYEPRMAPPGGHIVILQKVIEQDYDAVQDWDRHKADVEARLLRGLDRVLPGVERHIEVCTSASAATSQRFTLNRFGAMLGWEMSPSQLGRARPGVETPVRGLYLVGHWARPGGGITPVMVSAVQAAQTITGRRPSMSMNPTQPPALAATAEP